jgi:hypothetical protein
MAESELAVELRLMAAVLWRDADKQSDPDEARLTASAWHQQALMIEAGVGIDSIDDCTEMYADVDLFAVIDRLDESNTCTDPGDHLWLTDKTTGETACVHCRAPATPVYATREAE